jgi:isopentenyl-diphosphate Delta-isomerase
MAGRIAVVDTANRFLRWTERSEIHEHRLLHRSVHVFIFDNEGRLILQQRAYDKDTWAGAWDLSCSGHIEESDYLAGPDERLDEVYAQVALRELEEELGLRAELGSLGRFGPEAGPWYEHLELFIGRSDGPFVLQPEEVVAWRAVSRAELATLARDQEVVLTSSLLTLSGLLQQRGLWPDGP